MSVKPIPLSEDAAKALAVFLETSDERSRNRLRRVAPFLSVTPLVSLDTTPWTRTRTVAYAAGSGLLGRRPCCQRPTLTPTIPAAMNAVPTPTSAGSIPATR